MACVYDNKVEVKGKPDKLVREKAEFTIKKDQEFLIGKNP